MFVSIEVSLYPLNKEFLPPINEFINSLEKYDKVEIRTNVMSTQLFGEFDDLIKILKVEVEKTFKKEINSVFNLKIINGDSRKYDWRAKSYILLGLLFSIESKRYKIL